jgi:periplasmic protein CpxP/Spy
MTRHLPHKTLLSLTLAAAVLGLSATAMAQGNTGPEASQTAPASTQAADGQRMGRMHRHSQHHAHMQSRHTERLEQLKADLKLAPEQEPAWLAFVARTAPAAQPMGTADRTDWSKLNTVQRLERMEAQHEAHSATMKQRIDATRSFYASLSDEQKQVFDQRAMGGMMRTGMHGGHHMGKPGEPGKPGGQMHRHGQGKGGMSCQSQS